MTKRAIERPIEDMVAEANATAEAAEPKKEPEILLAEEASKRAEQAFRRTITKLVLQAIDTGVNQIEVNVTHIDRAVVARFVVDMQASGYVAGTRSENISSGGRKSERMDFLNIRFESQAE
jgi:hypothetical protein